MISKNDAHSAKIDPIIAQIRSCQSALVAFSGGVDSSVVATLAKHALGDNAIAVTVDNGVLHHDEIKEAAALAETIGIHHLSITLNPLGASEVKHNDPERCYYCKKMIFSALRSLADSLHLKTVLDGTHASDFEAYRPGLKALEEMDVVSPLLGLTKEDIRGFARALSLPNADAPSRACLLTSFPYGTTITAERLERLRSAERAMRALGIEKVKIKDHDGFARIEVDRSDAETVIAHSTTISDTFVGLGFAYVALDLQWYRFGSMDVALNPTKLEVSQLR